MNNEELDALITRLKELEDPQKEAVPSFADTDWRTLSGVVAGEIESLRQQLSAAYEAGKRDVSEDLEQAAFEKWLYDKCPSGDVESVQRQWLKSYEYAEFAGKLEQAAQIESLRQQLAAALAAIKSKDAALQSAISAHGYESGDLHDALAIQPDDDALKAWLGEPVVWMQSNHLSMFENQACGSQSMLARCSDHQLQPDYKPLYSPKGLK